MTHSAEHSGIKRLYYSISEVSQLVDEEQYVLRYWETEFEQLRPQKNRAGNRIYTDKELDLLRTIKYLLREKRFTIDGAKEHLRSLYTVPPPPDATSQHASNLASEEITSEKTETISGRTSPEILMQSKVQISPPASKHTLSREELFELRDTLRELLSVVEQK